jgi:hypothetical protein
MKGLAAVFDLRPLSENLITVSYSFDDSDVWSEAVNYPSEQVKILVPSSESIAHFTPGDHTVTFRVEADGDIMTEEDFYYRVNSRPVIEAQNAEPLTFKARPSGAVILPLATSDGDGDEVSVYYQFDGDGEWMRADSDLGGNVVLPNGAFAGKGNNGRNGFIEFAGYDGYDRSEEIESIGYSIEEQDLEERLVEGMLSPAALVGIVIGAIAVIALGIAILVVTTKKKPESSSSGLVEN